MKTQPYFQTIVNAKSETERQNSITELISRGFEVYLLKEFSREGNSWQDTGYRDRDGAKFKYAGSTSRTVYSAVMRRYEPVESKP